MTMSTDSNDFPANLLELDLPSPATPDAIDADIAALAPVAPVANFDHNATLADALTEIATAGMANAEGAASGSLASGSMRGVGFSSAAGYVTALANGTKEPTTSQYLDTLRHTYAYTDAMIADLTIGTIAQIDLPVGPGIVVDSSGGLTPREAMALMRAQRAQHAKAPAPVIEVESAPLFGAGEVCEAGLITDTRTGTIFGPGRASITGYSVAQADIVALCDGTGIEGPGIKSTKAQFGKVMATFRAYQGATLIARAVNSKDAKKLGLDWPASLVSRFTVGSLDGSGDLGSLGPKLMVAELVDLEDGGSEIRFNGGSVDMRAKVRERFEELCGASILTSTDLLSWYRRTMTREFDAVEDGAFLLVLGTGEDCERAKAFTRKIRANNMMGRRIPFVAQSDRESVDWQEFCENMGSGLVAQVDALRKRYEDKLVAAQERDIDKCVKAYEKVGQAATDADKVLAARRAKILSLAANTLFHDLAKLTEKCSSMRPAIGAANTREAVAACEALRAEYAPLCEGIDSTSSLAAAIELD